MKDFQVTEIVKLMTNYLFVIDYLINQFFNQLIKSL